MKKKRKWLSLLNRAFALKLWPGSQVSKFKLLAEKT